MSKAAREEYQHQQQLQQHQQQREQHQQMMQVDHDQDENGGGGAEAAAGGSNSSSSSVVNWASQPCPLKQLKRNLITVEDVAHTIARSSFAKSAVAGIGCNLSREKEGAGRHIQRWRLGLDLHQLIEK